MGGGGTGGAATGAGTGTGMGGTGAGAGITTPGSSTLSPPFGNAYGPSGVGPDYSAAATLRPAFAAAAAVLAAAPLVLRFI
jgi:hypothetical protein